MWEVFVGNWCELYAAPASTARFVARWPTELVLAGEVCDRERQHCHHCQHCTRRPPPGTFISGPRVSDFSGR